MFHHTHHRLRCAGRTDALAVGFLCSLDVALMLQAVGWVRHGPKLDGLDTLWEMALDARDQRSVTTYQTVGWRS